MSHNAIRLLVVSLVAHTLAFPQGGVDFGLLLGDVLDESGAIIPNARVTARNQRSGAEHHARTDASGHFLVPLPASSYNVTVEAPGFREESLRDLQLEIGATARVNMVLRLAAAKQETQVVAGAAPPVENARNGASWQIPEVNLRSLPLNQRSFTALVTQQPGMVQIGNAARPGPTSVLFGQGSQISANGQWGSSVAYIMDGVRINNSGYSAPGTASGGDVPGVEAIQEFRVLTNSFSAAYGGATGAVVSFATRSGTNASHGSLYEYLRNSKLDARGPFDLLDTNGDGRGDLPPFRRNQFGGTYGGPLRKNKAFLFSNYEGLRQSLTTTDTATVPTLAARNGGVGGTSDFSVTGPVRQADGTYRRGPVAIPSAVKPILELYPLPNSRDFGNGVGQFLFANSQPVSQHFGLVKVDQVPANGHLLSARYSIVDASSSGFFNLPAFQYPKSDRLHNLVLTHTATLSPRLVNFLSASFTRSVLHAETVLTQTLRPEQFTGNPDRGRFGVISVGASASIGASGALTTLGNNTDRLGIARNSFPVADDLTYARGNHILRVGALVNRRQENWTRINVLGGNISFRSLNDLLAGNPATLQIGQDNANMGYGYRTTQIAWYVEDSWRATSSVSVSAGLRHDFQVPVFAEVNNRQGNVRFPTDAGPTQGTPFNNYSLRQFEPRLGLVWNPWQGRNVLRAGSGIFHDQMGYANFFSELFSNGPGPQYRTLFGEPIAPDRNLYSPIPFPRCTNCTAPITSSSFLAGVFNPVHSPTAVQWYLQLERRVGDGLTATLTYAGSHSYHLPRQIEANYNLPCEYNGLEPVFTGQCGRAAPQVGSSTLLARLFDANASYNSASASLVKRAADLTFSSHYTFAKALSESDTTNSGAIVTGVPSSSQYPLNRRLDRSESTFSIRHRVTGNVVYEIPMARNHKYLGGWKVAALGEVRSGQPFSVLAGFGITGVGDTTNNPDRPDLIRSNTAVGRVERWFDPKAYALPPRGRLGNAPRTSVRGPAFSTVDVSILKDFSLSDRLTLQFRAEAFNVLNRANFGLPFNQLYVGNVPQFNRVPTAAELEALPCRLTAAEAQTHSCNPLAGAILNTVGTPRQSQLALRVTF